MGFPMNQNRLAVPSWSYAMEKLPPWRILELGYYNGGFTCAIGIHAWAIGAKILSYDIQEVEAGAKRLGAFLGIEFRQQDVFSEAALADMKAFIGGYGTTFVLCDNGNKKREFRMLAPFLKPGDVIAAHDYWIKPEWWPCQEIKLEDVADVVAEHGLERFMPEVFDEAAWLVYRKPPLPEPA